MPDTADSTVLDAYYQYIDEQRYDDLFELFASDIVYHRPGQATLEGIEEYKRFYLEERPLENGSHTIADYLIDEDRICARGTFSGTLHGDPVEFGFADIHQFNAEGKIEVRWTYTDRDAV